MRNGFIMEPWHRNSDDPDTRREIHPSGAGLLFGTLLLLATACQAGECAPEPGIPAATPEEVGLTRPPLEAMTRLLHEDAYPNVHALLIAVCGRLVYEEYFHGTDRRWTDAPARETVEITFDRDVLHDTRSAGKSITAMLFGIALGDGLIESVEQPVIEWFPELGEGFSDEKRSITLEHVLTMTAGLSWNESEVPYTNPENDEIQMDRSDNPAAFVLRRPIVAEPGSKWYYNSGLPTVLGYVIARSADTSFGSFARQRLFEPLDMQDIEWGGCCSRPEIPELEWSSERPWAQQAVPAGSLWIRPVDLLKFGLTVADDGRWQDRQIIPAEWVRSALEPRITVIDELDHGAGARSSVRYGYQWWIRTFELPYGQLTVHEATGNGGQRVWLIPDLDLVAVHMTGNYNKPGSGFQAEALLVERIVPWAMGIESDYRHQPGWSIRRLAPGEWPEMEFDPSQYTGRYRNDRQEVEIRARGTNLLLTGDGRGETLLLPESPDVFALGERTDGVPVKLFRPNFRFAFVRDPQGRVVRYEIRRAGDETALWVMERLTDRSD